MEKQKKFITIREAIRDIIDAILRPECVEEIAVILSFLEGREWGDNDMSWRWYQPKMQMVEI